MKLIDFGFALDLENLDKSHVDLINNKVMGTLLYVAPEILDKQHNGS